MLAAATKFKDYAGSALSKMPKIISIKPKEKSLLDYKNAEYFKPPIKLINDAQTMLADKEVKVLLIWAIIAPSAALAYLVWIKYPRLKLFAIFLFAVSLFQFVGQWGGLVWVIQRLVNP